MANKPLIQLYNKLSFEKFECLYCDKEDVGITGDLPVQEIDFKDIDKFIFDYRHNIVVLGDTHDFTRLDNVIKSIAFKVPTLIHAGDFGTCETTMESLLKFPGQIYGALGNHDRQYAAAYLPYIKKYPNLHMSYFHQNFQLDSMTNVHLRHENDDLEKVDFQIGTQIHKLYIYGHTHKPVLWRKGRISILNAGILCDAGNNKPTFCIYNLVDPLRSVFVRNI